MRDSEKDALMRAVGTIVTREVSRAVAPLMEKLRELEARPLPKDGVGIKSSFTDAGGLHFFTLTDGSVVQSGITNGVDGTDGVDGKDGVDGRDGINGVDGKDGAPGVDGKDGKDGAPGPVFDLRDIVFDAFGYAIVRDGHRVPIAIPNYRGVWREGRYHPGNCVTLAGSLFVAMKETTAKPLDGTDSVDWQLAVKRGRDGKSLRLEDIEPLIKRLVAIAVAGVKAGDKNGS